MGLNIFTFKCINPMSDKKTNGTRQLHMSLSQFEEMYHADTSQVEETDVSFMFLIFKRVKGLYSPDEWIPMKG